MKTHKLTIIILLSFLTIIECKKKEPQITAPKNLTGWLTERHLLDEFPKYKEGKETYQPDAEIITKLSRLDNPFHILVFLGTYCPDSEREVPRFLKVVEQLKNENFSYKLFGLNRANVDTSGMREKYDVEYVPTFIVYHEDQEIGRIIETPISNIESDLLEICSTF